MINLYLYASNICIKKLKVKNDKKVLERPYVINVWFKKFIFGKNFVKIIVRPKALIHSDSKSIHVSVVYEKGVEL